MPAELNAGNSTAGANKVLKKSNIGKVVCLNCYYETCCLREEDGFSKLKCPYCGAVTMIRSISRRHVQIDVYAPKGQKILENEYDGDMITVRSV